MTQLMAVQIGWFILIVAAVVTGYFGGMGVGWIVARLHIKWRLRRILSLKGPSCETACESSNDRNSSTPSASPQRSLRLVGTAASESRLHGT